MEFSCFYQPQSLTPLLKAWKSATIRFFFANDCPTQSRSPEDLGRAKEAEGRGCPAGRPSCAAEGAPRLSNKGTRSKRCARCRKRRPIQRFSITISPLQCGARSHARVWTSEGRPVHRESGNSLPDLPGVSATCAPPTCTRSFDGPHCLKRSPT